MDQVKIQLKLVKSPLPGIKDDYTAIVVTNGTATAQDLVADAHESEPQISEIAAKQVFDTEWLYVGRMLAEGKYVNIGGIGLAPCVDGSLLHADEEVGSDRIGIQATIYDNALIQALKSMDVATTTDPDALPFVFTKVEDVTTNAFGAITPGGAFKTLGDRQSCGLEGERIEIVDAAGVRHVIADATGDREGLWLLATAPTTLAKGKATVTVFSRGKNTPEAEPTPSPARPVTILAAATPEPTPLFEDRALGIRLTAVRPESCETLTPDWTWRLEGEGLAESDGSRGGFRTVDWQCGGREGGAMMSFAADGKSGTLELVDAGGIASGTHELTLKISTEDGEGMPSASGEVKLTVVK